MATYLTKAKYSNAACAGMVASPHDRGAAAKALFKAAGAKILTIYFEVSSGCVVVISEATAEQMAAIGLVVGASGAFSNVESTELISMADMLGAMTSAQGVAKRYAAPNKS